MKNSSSYSAYPQMYSPSYQSPPLTSFNSFASTKYIVANPSINPHKKTLSTHNSYHCFHKKSDSMSSSSRINSQIEIMNMKLSFDLLNHKIKQLNSIVLPKDNVLPQRKEISSYVSIKKVDNIKPYKFTYYNPVFSPLSSYVSYLGNTKKKNEDEENKKDSIDLSKIAGDLVETLDPSGNNSIVGLGLKESNVIDKEEEGKKRIEENENDKNIKFLNDLIKSSEEKEKEKDDVINTEVIAFDDNKEEDKEEKEVMFKAMKKPTVSKQKENEKTEEVNTIITEEKKEEKEPEINKEEIKEEEPVIKEEEKKEEEPSHKAVFSKIRNLFNNDDEEEDEQNDNEEEENNNTVEEQSNENIESEPAEETNDPPIEEEEESTNKEVIESDSKDNSRKKLDFSEEQEDEKSNDKDNKEEEEEEEDEDAIFAEIIQKAKELEELNSKKPPSLPLETPLKSNQKIKKSVTFSEDKKVFIQFHENDMITQLNIIDSNGKEATFKPIEFSTYLNTLKSPLKLRPIIQNSSMPDTPSKNNLQTLLSESDKEHSSCTETPKKPLSPMKDPKSPMRRNIQLIQTIEDYKKKGMNYPRVKKQRAHTPIPQHHCRKFKENPQKFFTEDLCENVLKAYDLKKKKSNNSRLCKSECKKNVIRVEEAIKKEKKDNTKIYDNTMYNIKKYFEENTIDKEDNLSDH